MGKASRRKAVARTKELSAATKPQLKRVGPDQIITIQANLPQEQKISHAICMILDSEISGNASIEEYRARTEIIVLAWNMSLFPMTEEDENAALQDLADDLENTDPVAGPAVVAEISRLMKKKRAMFPDDDRYIATHEVKRVGNKLIVTAATLAAPSPSSDPLASET